MFFYPCFWVNSRRINGTNGRLDQERTFRLLAPARTWDSFTLILSGRFRVWAPFGAAGENRATKVSLA